MGQERSGRGWCCEDIGPQDGVDLSAGELTRQQIRYYRLQWTVSLSLSNCSRPPRGSGSRSGWSPSGAHRGSTGATGNHLVTEISDKTAEGNAAARS